MKRYVDHAMGMPISLAARIPCDEAWAAVMADLKSADGIIVFADAARLDGTDAGGREVAANFGVIDAMGGAAYFETDARGFRRFDAAGAKGGFLVRSNYSHSGRKGAGTGVRREARAARAVRWSGRRGARRSRAAGCSDRSRGLLSPRTSLASRPCERTWMPVRTRLVRSSSDGSPMSTERVVLVTGGNRGIGRAIAERFVAAGYRTAVTARSGEGPAGTLTVRADVTDAASLDAAFTEVEQQLGPVEIVVANAGITKDTLLLRMTEEDFDSVVATNLGGTFRVVKRASKGMLRAKWGRVILISSVVGLYGSAGQINYSSSKAALVGFARSLTRELGGRGITANVVAPGFIETDMTAELPAETQAEYRRNIPAGRFATADEVAGVVTWLASEDAAYISGAVIPVDGGLGMGH